jgi:hypothetical protein
VTHPDGAVVEMPCPRCGKRLELVVGGLRRTCEARCGAWYRAEASAATAQSATIEYAVAPGFSTRLDSGAEEDAGVDHLTLTGRILP